MPPPDNLCLALKIIIEEEAGTAAATIREGLAFLSRIRRNPVLRGAEDV